MKLLFVSLGCDKNLVDSEEMLGLLSEAGFTFTDDETEAEVSVVNTCCFIGDAKEESIGTLLEMAGQKETGRCKVLIAAGETELDVSVVNLSAEDEKALNLALNKIAGVWDDEALSQLLQELAETAGVDETLTGFDPGELDELLESLSGVTAGFALPGADAYVNSFFESGAQEKSRKESEPAKAAPVSMEEDRAADMSGSILVYGLTPDRLEVLTGYLAENGYTYRVEAGGA